MSSPDGQDDPQFDEVVDSLNRFERTIDVQISLMNELDEKASNVVRYTALLLGGIFTALSLLPRSDAVSLDSVGTLPTVVFLIGTASLVVAIVAAIITYLSSVQEYGPDPAYGDNVADGDIQSPDYETVLLYGYTSAVDNNRRVIDVNARRFRWSLLALLVGIVYSASAGGLLVVNQPPVVEVLLLGVVSMFVAPVGYSIYAEEFLVLDRKTRRDD